MSDPCREQIAEAVVTVLQGIAITGLVIERNRWIPLTETEELVPRLIVYEGDEIPRKDFCGQDDWTLPIEIAGYTVLDTTLTTTEAARAKQLNFLRGKVVAAMASNPTLSGKCSWAQPAPEQEGVSPGFISSDGAGFRLIYEVDYATIEGDPFQFISA